MKRLINSITLRLVSPVKKARMLGVLLGANCKIAKSVNFGSEPYLVRIGDNFYSSDNVQFLTHDGSVNVLRNLYEEYRQADYFAPIVVGNNVFLGYGVTVLPDARIGDNVIVGAHSLVRGVLASNSIYAGVPARYICSIDEYLSKRKSGLLNTKSLCAQDKKRYLEKWLLEQHPDF